MSTYDNLVNLEITLHLHCVPAHVSLREALQILELLKGESSK